MHIENYANNNSKSSYQLQGEKNHQKKLNQKGNITIVTYVASLGILFRES